MKTSETLNKILKLARSDDKQLCVASIKWNSSGASLPGGMTTNGHGALGNVDGSLPGIVEDLDAFKQALESKQVYDANLQLNFKDTSYGCGNAWALYDQKTDRVTVDESEENCAGCEYKDRCHVAAI